MDLTEIHSRSLVRPQWGHITKVKFDFWMTSDPKSWTVTAFILCLGYRNESIFSIFGSAHFMGRSAGFTLARALGQAEIQGPQC